MPDNDWDEDNAQSFLSSLDNGNSLDYHIIRGKQETWLNAQRFLKTKERNV